MINIKSKLIITILIILVILSSVIILISRSKNKDAFNEQRTFDDLEYQVGLGPRTIGSDAHEIVANWITSTLLKQNWEVEIQQTTSSDVAIKNIIAKKGSGGPWIIIASHYDTRLLADKDSTFEGRKQPVVGANDGASSVAVLLELARVIPENTNKQIWLVFFDAEDNGGILGYDWALGSQYFVSMLKDKPDSVVILDMIGDKDLDIYMEKNSDPELNQQIWGVASGLGYSQFIATYKYELIDDHVPFVQVGIRAADIIDFDYPYWHTTHDTIDKVSADSLNVVGETILNWLLLSPE